MSSARLTFLTLLAMIAFAGNSLLCRIALRQVHIDAASFTSIRLISGAAALWLITRFLRRDHAGNGNWLSATALFVYAACFSFAYIGLTTAMGALLLFGAVQATMIGYGLWIGERLVQRQVAGLLLALGGLVGLLLPGISAPPLTGAIVMLIAGVAWGVYSLRGKGTGDPLRITAGNFLRSVFFTVLLSMLLSSRMQFDLTGVLYAIFSGAVASGVGYAIWYSILPRIKATSAATVQLSVPVLATFGGVIILGEPVTTRLTLASIAILGGIALVTMNATRTNNL